MRVLLVNQELPYLIKGVLTQLYYGPVETPTRGGTYTSERKTGRESTRLRRVFGSNLLSSVTVRGTY